MSKVFTLESNLTWLTRIPEIIKEIYLGTLYNNGVINEMYNKITRKWFKKTKTSEHVGVWGWNTWCGVHTLPLLMSGEAAEIYKRTVDVGFDRLEPKTNLLPHAILHKNGEFGTESTYKCYGGVHGEGYNIDNMVCWAKMAMEYFLITNDKEWFTSEKFGSITHTIDYFLNEVRDKYNPSLVYAGVEGCWTECTDWELDNANVNVNMIRTLELAIECQKILGSNASSSKLDYPKIREEIIANFNKPVNEGGFWHEENGFYIHGNDGKGEVIHGDKYFESTTNYFALLWDIAPEKYEKRIWNYIGAHADKIEQPYPVLTNYLPRTGARRKNYGLTVTNGDIWFVLGAHATAARLQAGYVKEGSDMFKTIMDYERKHGIIHNCVYQNGTTNAVWDPEVGNYGAPFAALVLGVLGMKLSAEGIKFKISGLMGLKNLTLNLFIFGKPCTLSLHYTDEGILENSIITGEHKFEIKGADILIKR